MDQLFSVQGLVSFLHRLAAGAPDQMTGRFQPHMSDWFCLIQSVFGWMEMAGWAALLIGLAILIALAVLIGLVINTRGELEREVQERTSELQESEMMSRLLMNSLSVGVVIVDPETHVIERVNAAAANLIGAPEEHIVGKVCHRFMCPAIEGGCPITDLHQDVDNSDRTLICSDERSIPILKSVKRIVIGGREKLLEIFIDISRRKKMEEELRISRERLDQLAEHGGELIWEFDEEGVITYVSQACKSIYGFDEEELIGKLHFYDFYPEEGREEFRQRAFMLLKSRRPFKNLNTQLVSRSGQVFDVLTSGVPLYRSDGKFMGYRGANRDITEQRRAEESLRESEELFRTITISANDAIIKLDHEGRISYWNRAAEEIFQYTMEEVLGRNLHTMLAPSRFHAQHIEAFNTFRETGSGAAIGKTLELAALRKNGEEFPVELSLSAVQIKGNWEAIGILRDITERKKAEEELRRSNQLLEEAVAKANKLAVQAETANRAKSEFLANMSHEIRTPMNGILGMTDLLLNTALEGEQRRYTEIIQSSGDALLALINDILDFSKIEAGRLELETIDFDLQSMMDNLCSSLAMKAQEKGLEFICTEGPDVPEILQGDPGRLRQILTNLVGNAIKFTRSGEVTVRITVESETDDDVLLRFTVRDTGIGIPTEKFAILFDKFSQVDASTTRQYGGTGLGLAISKQLAIMMGGEIGVRSEKGRGSEFWFTARLLKSSAGETLKAPVHSSMQGARVLIVDDNATNREVLRVQTASWGMIPSEAVDGPGALQMLYQALDTGTIYSLAIIDMQMPGMDGEQLGRAIRSDRRFDMTGMVLMTSMGMRGDAQRVEDAGFSAYLTKPVRPSELHTCLATVLMQKGKASEGRPIVTRHSIRDVFHILAKDREKQARILIVEDNLINQQVAQEILNEFGLLSDTAVNGAEALKILSETQYDLVLMDVQMPVMDGLEATKKIRSAESGGINPEIPIVAMTAHALQSDRDMCLKAGMSDYVSKPVNPKALAEVLEKWLPEGKGAFSEEAVKAEKAEEGKVAEADARDTGDQTELKTYSVINREGILICTMGNEKLAARILDAFITELPGLVNMLSEYASNEDGESATRQAHTIRGAAASTGCETIQQIALKMEMAARESRFGDITAMIPDLKGQLEKVREKREELFA